MTEKELAKFICLEMNEDTGNRQDLNDVDDYLFDSVDLPVKIREEVEFLNCFYTEPEVTVPADEFVYYG